MSSIDFEINHHGFPIMLEVSYSFFRGTTNNSGDDPHVIEIEEAIDGTGSNVLDKLTEKQLEQIEEAIYQREVI